MLKEIVLRGGGGSDKEELLDALGLRSKYIGEYVALRGFEVLHHDLDLYRLGEEEFVNKEARRRVVVTNAGVPKHQSSISKAMRFLKMSLMH